MTKKLLLAYRSLNLIQATGTKRPFLLRDGTRIIATYKDKNEAESAFYALVHKANLEVS